MTAVDTLPPQEVSSKMDHPASSNQVGSTTIGSTTIGSSTVGDDSPQLRRRLQSTAPIVQTNRRNSLPSPTVAPGFSPTVVLDGSKLVMRLVRNDSFVVDAPCKIMLTTPKIRLEKPVAWQTAGTCTEPENTVVIDTGLLGHRFVPIPLSHYGTVYTKEGTVHVTVGSGIRRAKIHSRNLPYRTSNKFHCVSMMETEAEDEATSSSATGWFMARQNTNSALSSIDPAQAVKLIKQMASDTQSGVVYIRADDSVLRYKLKHDEKIELQSGKVIAWTVGVRFEMSNYCCFRFVSAVHGEGTVWIQNGARPRGVVSST